MFLKFYIFTFATGELSQDAFICWCLNWINEPDNVTTHRYRQLGLDLLAKLIENQSNSDVISKVMQQDQRAVLGRWRMAGREHHPGIYCPP